MTQVMGVDPGEQTGIAVYRNGRLAELLTICPVRYGSFLACNMPDMLVIEDSRLQSHVFTAHLASTSKVLSAAQVKIALKIARNVGMVDGYCSLLEDIADSLGIPLIQVSPRDKGAKVGAERFGRITHWTGKSNQHERDAAMVSWRYRNWRQE